LAAEPELVGPGQAEWLDRLDADHDNLRAAIDWSLETEHGELGLRVAISLRRFWEVRGHFQEAKRYLSQLIAFDQPPALRALALRDLVFVTSVLNELDEAERFANDRREVCLALGDRHGARRALQNLGVVADLRGELDRARAIYEEVLASAREDHDDVGVALNNLASVAWKQNRLDDAESLYEASLEEFETIGDEATIASTCTDLAGVRLYQRRREDAQPMLRRGLLLYQQLGSKPGLASAFECAALAADPRAAAMLLGKANDLRVEIGDQQGHFPGDLHSYERATAFAVEALGQEAFDVARAEGGAMSLDDAIALAHEVIDAG
jgi:tetratricopeptide (TPR) repeat protein